jgi:hypothetical protein
MEGIGRWIVSGDAVICGRTGEVAAALHYMMVALDDAALYAGTAPNQEGA